MLLKQIVTSNGRKSTKRCNNKDLKRKPEPIAFPSFEGKLSNACLDQLKLINIAQSEESSFVGIILNDLYCNDNEVLKKKTLSNRSKDNESSKIPPKKRKIVFKLFNERLSHEPKEEVSEYRKENLSKLIRNAIDNANRKK